MTWDLGTLILSASVDLGGAKKDLENFKGYVKSQQLDLSGYSNSVAAVTRQINSMVIKPSVDMSQLHELNKLYAIKKRDHDDLAGHVKRNPIKPIVDGSELKEAIASVKELERSITNLKTKTSVDVRLKVEHIINGDGFVNKFEKSADKVADKIKDKLEKVRLKTQGGGFFGTFTNQLTREFAKGFSDSSGVRKKGESAGKFATDEQLWQEIERRTAKFMQGVVYKGGAGAGVKNAFPEFEQWPKAIKRVSSLLDNQINEQFQQIQSGAKAPKDLTGEARKVYADILKNLYQESKASGLTAGEASKKAYKTLSSKAGGPAALSDYIEKTLADTGWHQVRDALSGTVSMLRKATNVIHLMNAYQIDEEAEVLSKELRKHIPKAKKGEVLTIFASPASDKGRAVEEFGGGIQSLLPGSKVHGPTLEAYDFTKGVKDPNFFESLAAVVGKTVGGKVVAGSAAQTAGGGSAISDPLSGLLFGYSRSARDILATRKAAIKQGYEPENVQVLGHSMGAFTARQSVATTDLLKQEFKGVGVAIGDYFKELIPESKNYRSIYNKTDPLNAPLKLGIFPQSSTQYSTSALPNKGVDSHAYFQSMLAPEFRDLVKEVGFKGFAKENQLPNSNRDLTVALANFSKEILALRSVHVAKNLAEGKPAEFGISSPAVMDKGGKNFEDVTNISGMIQTFKTLDELLKPYLPQNIKKTAEKQGDVVLTDNFGGAYQKQYEEVNKQLGEFAQYLGGKGKATLEGTINEIERLKDTAKAQAIQIDPSKFENDVNIPNYIPEPGKVAIEKTVVEQLNEVISDVVKAEKKLVNSALELEKTLTFGLAPKYRAYLAGQSKEVAQQLPQLASATYNSVLRGPLNSAARGTGQFLGGTYRFAQGAEGMLLGGTGTGWVKGLMQKSVVPALAAAVSEHFIPGSVGAAMHVAQGGAHLATQAGGAMLAPAMSHAPWMVQQGMGWLGNAIAPNLAMGAGALYTANRMNSAAQGLAGAAGNAITGGGGGKPPKGLRGGKVPKNLPVFQGDNEDSLEQQEKDFNALQQSTQLLYSKKAAPSRRGKQSINAASSLNQLNSYIDRIQELEASLNQVRDEVRPTDGKGYKAQRNQINAFQVEVGKEKSGLYKEIQNNIERIKAAANQGDEGMAAYVEKLKSVLPNAAATANAKGKKDIERILKSLGVSLPTAAKTGAVLPTLPAATQLPAAIPTTQPHSAVREVDVNSLTLDPQRFQYKMAAAASGATGSLSGVKKFDHDIAGVLQVWRDPEDGKDYVINGHNRLNLAKQTGTEKITARYIEANSAAEARAIGAKTNIAEGQGTSLDAAKYFRDSGIKSAEDLHRLGIPLTKAVATEGLGLSKLSPSLFDQTVLGGIPVQRAATIGQNLEKHEDQHALIALLEKEVKRGRKLSNDVVKELIDIVKSSATATEQQVSLFGSFDTQKNLAVERAQLQSAIKTSLSKDGRLFGMVAKKGSADTLGRGGNVIDTAQSASIAHQSVTALKVFDQLKDKTGGISQALNVGAERIHSGEKVESVKKDVLASIMHEIDAELAKVGPALKGAGHDTMQGFLGEIGREIPSVRQAGESSGDAYQQGFTDSMEIQSPSKRMKEFALNTILGFTNLIETQLERFTGAGQKSAEAYIAGLNEDLKKNAQTVPVESFAPKELKRDFTHPEIQQSLTGIAPVIPRPDQDIPKVTANEYFRNIAAIGVAPAIPAPNTTRAKKQLQDFEHDAEEIARRTGRMYGEILSNQIEEVAPHIAAATKEIASEVKRVAGIGGAGIGGFLGGLGVKFDFIKQKIEAAGIPIGKFGSQIKALGFAALGAVGLFSFGDSIVRFGQASIQASIQMETLKRSLNLSGGGQSVTTIGKLKKLSDDLGISIKSAADGLRGLSGATLNTALAGDPTLNIIKGFSSAIAGQGLSQEDASGVFLAVQQMASKGTVSMEELRLQLAERLPQALNVAAESMGKTTPEFIKMVAAGDVLSTELLPKMADRLAATSGLAGSADFAQASLNRFGNAVFNLQTAIGNVALDAVKGPLEDLAKVVQFTADHFDLLATAAIALGVSAIAPLVLNFVSLLPVFGPLALAMTRQIGLMGALKLAAFDFSMVIKGFIPLLGQAYTALNALVATIWPVALTVGLVTFTRHLMDINSGTESMQKLNKSLDNTLDRLKKINAQRGLKDLAPNELDSQKPGNKNSFEYGLAEKLGLNPALATASFNDLFSRTDQLKEQVSNDSFPAAMKRNAESINEVTKSIDKLIGSGNSGRIKEINTQLRLLDADIAAGSITGASTAQTKALQDKATRLRDERNNLLGNSKDTQATVDDTVNTYSVLLEERQQKKPGEAGYQEAQQQIPQIVKALEGWRAKQTQINGLTGDSPKNYEKINYELNKIAIKTAQIAERNRLASIAEQTNTLANAPIGGAGNRDLGIEKAKQSVIDAQRELAALQENAKSIDNVTKGVSKTDVEYINKILKSYGESLDTIDETTLQKLKSSSANDKVKGSIQTILDNRVLVTKSKEDIAKAQQAVVDSQRNAQQSTVDASQSLIDFNNSTTQQMRDLLITVRNEQKAVLDSIQDSQNEIKKSIQQLKQSKFQNDLRSKISGIASDSATQLSDGIIGLVTKLFEISNTEIEKRVNDQSTFKKIRDIALNQDLFSNQIVQSQYGIQKSIGGESGQTVTPGKTIDIVTLGKAFQAAGLKVGENPHFGDGRVSNVHKGPYHYSGQAIDVTDWRNPSDDKQWRQWTRSAAEMLKGTGLTEVLGPKDEGQLGTSGEHLHVAIAGSVVVTQRLIDALAKIGVSLPASFSQAAKTIAKTGDSNSQAAQTISKAAGSELYGHKTYSNASQLSTYDESKLGDPYQQKLNSEALGAFRAMQGAAKAQGIELHSQIGYRSVADQQALWDKKLAQGMKPAEIARTLAPPGHSEHHTGYALDLAGSGNGLLSQGDRGYSWLQKNAARFGFQQSFQAGGQVAEEPWHWRFAKSQTAKAALGLAGNMPAPAQQAATVQTVTQTVKSLGTLMASWYGPGFNGKKAADGSTFNENAMTVAHKTLPFGTMLKIVGNGGEAIAKVTDRGPYIGGRDIDLSKAVAEKVGIIGPGSGPVKVEIVNSATSSTPSTNAGPQQAANNPQPAAGSLSPAFDAQIASQLSNIPYAKQTNLVQQAGDLQSQVIEQQKRTKYIEYSKDIREQLSKAQQLRQGLQDAVKAARRDAEDFQNQLYPVGPVGGIIDQTVGMNRQLEDKIQQLKRERESNNRQIITIQQTLAARQSFLDTAKAQGASPVQLKQLQTVIDDLRQNLKLNQDLQASSGEALSKLQGTGNARFLKLNRDLREAYVQVKQSIYDMTTQAQSLNDRLTTGSAHRQYLEGLRDLSNQFEAARLNAEKLNETLDGDILKTRIKLVAAGEAGDSDAVIAYSNALDVLTSRKAEATKVSERFGAASEKEALAQERLKFERSQQSELSNARADYLDRHNNPYQATGLRRNDALAQQAQQYTAERKRLEALSFAGQDVQTLIDNLDELNNIKLDQIREQFKTLEDDIRGTIKESTKGAFGELFSKIRESGDIIKSFKDTLMSFFDKISGKIFDLASDWFTSKIFGAPKKGIDELGPDLFGLLKPQKSSKEPQLGPDLFGLLPTPSKFGTATDAPMKGFLNSIVGANGKLGDLQDVLGGNGGVNGLFGTFGNLLGGLTGGGQGSAGGAAGGLFGLLGGLFGGGGSSGIGSVAGLSAGNDWGGIASSLAGLYYKGGVIPNYAKGGMADLAELGAAVTKSMHREKQMSGRDAMFGVFNAGEAILTPQAVAAMGGKAAIDKMNSGSYKIDNYAGGVAFSMDQPPAQSAPKLAAAAAPNSQDSRPLQIQYVESEGIKFVSQDQFERALAVTEERAANRGAGIVAERSRNSSSARRAYGF